MVYLVGFSQSINDHVIDCAANTVRIALFEELVAGHEHLLDLIEDLRVVAQPVIDDASTLE